MLFTWYEEQGILDHAFPSFNYVHSPEIWNFQNLGFETDSKMKLETALIEAGKRVVYPKMYKDWYLNIQNCQELLKDQYDYAIFKKSFVKAIQSLDNKRNTKFSEVYPELNYIYERLYDQSI